MTDEKIDAPKQIIKKTVALLILALSLIWKLLEQILLGKSFLNALEFSIGYLIPFFVISIFISIVFGFIRRSYSVAFITFSVLYVFLLFATNFLPLLVLNNLK